MKYMSFHFHLCVDYCLLCATVNVFARLHMDAYMH